MRPSSFSNTRQDLLTEHDVARMLRLSVSTVRRRRLLRQPPEWIKIGASVRYSPESVFRLIENSKQGEDGQADA